jgi:uncharacterized protein (TIGR02996 family)
MADQRDSFLKTIIENPEDDTPRLVFADWLEEHGETERAAFIRLQCELSHTALNSERYRHLFPREVELRKRCKEAWMTEDVGEPVLPFITRCYYERGFTRCYYERGFVYWLRALGDTLLYTNGRIFQRAPLRRLFVLGPKLDFELAHLLLTAPPSLQQLSVKIRHWADWAPQLLQRRFGDRFSLRRY